MEVTGNTDFLPTRKRRILPGPTGMVIVWKEAELPNLGSKQKFIRQQGKKQIAMFILVNWNLKAPIHSKFLISMLSIINRFKRELTSIAVSTVRLILHIKLGLSPSVDSVSDSIFTE